MKPALVYVVKPKNSGPQNNNSAAGFLSKCSDSDPNNFLSYVGVRTKIVNSLPENWFLAKSETGCDPFFEYIVRTKQVLRRERHYFVCPSS